MFSAILTFVTFGLIGKKADAVKGAPKFLLPETFGIWKNLLGAYDQEQTEYHRKLFNLKKEVEKAGKNVPEASKIASAEEEIARREAVRVYEEALQAVRSHEMTKAILKTFSELEQEARAWEREKIITEGKIIYSYAQTEGGRGWIRKKERRIAYYQENFFLCVVEWRPEGGALPIEENCKLDNFWVTDSLAQMNEDELSAIKDFQQK